MRTGGISTYSQSYALRLSLQRSQGEMAIAQGELASGQVADVSRTLGSRAGQYIAIEARMKSLESIAEANALVGARLEAADLALEGLNTNMQRMQEILINTRNGSAPAYVAVEQTAQLISDMTTKLNSTFDGNYLFSGVNTQHPALKDILDPAGPAQTAIEASFVAAFGFGRNDPAVGAISPAAMSNWLENGFAALFDSPNWLANWSGASAEAGEVPIDENQRIKTGATMNEPALRKLTMAYIITSSLGADKVPAETLNLMVDKSIGLLGEATIGVNAIRATLGSASNKVEAATESMKKQKDLFALAAGQMVNKDPYELSLRISDLSARLEASFSVTARMKALSLVKYL
ncbi:MAG: flagellar hook-associated family protein [Beijerinckiaceae bacterium]